MFKVGDRIICILEDNNAVGNFLIKNKCYTINTISTDDISNSTYLYLNERLNTGYNMRRFIKLSDFRKQKIKKIRNNERIIRI